MGQGLNGCHWHSYWMGLNSPIQSKLRGFNSLRQGKQVGLDSLSGEINGRSWNSIYRRLFER